MRPLVVDAAEANQRLHDIGASIQINQESVNRTLVDVVKARDAADTARREVQSSQNAVEDANAVVAAAQKRFDVAAASTYVNGPPGALFTAASPEDIIATTTAGQRLALSFKTTLINLQRARTKKANTESTARAAQLAAEQAVANAQRQQDTAAVELSTAQRQFGPQQVEVNRLVAERDTAQARLTAARATAAASPVPMPARVPSELSAARDDRWDPRDPSDTPGSTGDAGQWDTTLPMVPSANVAGDPIAIINAVLQISSTSAQLTADMGRKFLTKLGILPEASAAADPGITNGRIPNVNGQQASEFAIRRAMSQLGVPYSWGGGNANGPSRVGSTKEPIPSPSTVRACICTHSPAWASNWTTIRARNTTPDARFRRLRCAVGT